jgi:hypothetical protein
MGMSKGGEEVLQEGKRSADIPALLRVVAERVECNIAEPFAPVLDAGGGKNAAAARSGQGGQRVVKCDCR